MIKGAYDTGLERSCKTEEDIKFQHKVLKKDRHNGNFSMHAIQLYNDRNEIIEGLECMLIILIRKRSKKKYSRKKAFTQVAQAINICVSQHQCIKKSRHLPRFIGLKKE